MDALLLWVIAGLAAACLAVLVLLLMRSRSGSQGDTGALLKQELREHRKEMNQDSRELRKELSETQRLSADVIKSGVKELGDAQLKRLEAVEKRVEVLAKGNEERLTTLRDTVDKQLLQLREGNESKLDQMRKTVDEHLQTTLEKRLGESFKLVSDRLEAVHKGLGEMQNLATGVGDLKRMLTNVKARGTWGEYQLGAILEQILNNDQYAKNVETKPGSGQRVEFAVRLPGSGTDGKDPMWVPIDSKFPQEDYQRLLEASERADEDGVKRASKALANAVESAAKDICDKYIDPPNTTDYAILFLPTEGLYAEVIRQPGMMEKLQQNYRVTVAGPMNVTALLNTYLMGFRTMAIQERAGEVWQVLGAIKTEFGKFGDIMTKVKAQLETATRTIDEQVSRRARVMEKKLRDVQQLSEDQSRKVLDLDHTPPPEIEDEE
ncbi:MAG: DNA recombination protein RmuC [Gammaproteobacteria bacterium]